MLINTVSRQSPEGDIITRQKLERLALLVNEMPGVQGQVSLKTGSLPGTAAVDVVTRPGQKAGGYVGMDNLGTQVTGRSRVTGGAFVNGLFLTGDQLRFDGALSYEKEGLTNARAGYSLPGDMAPAWGWITAVWIMNTTLCSSLSVVIPTTGRRG